MAAEAKCHFRRASAADAAAIATLFARSRAEAMPWLPVMHTPDEDLAFFTSLLTHPGRIAEMAELDGILAGVLIQHAEWIEHLYMEPEYQGIGLGTELLKRAQARSTTLSLWCFQANTQARRFYEKHGFVLSELTDGAGNEERTPDALYVWPLHHQILSESMGRTAGMD